MVAQEKEKPQCFCLEKNVNNSRTLAGPLRLALCGLLTYQIQGFGPT